MSTVAWKGMCSFRWPIKLSNILDGSSTVCLPNWLRQRHYGRFFAEDIFKCIFMKENVWITIKIPLKCVPKGSIKNIPSLGQIMAWRQPGDKTLSEAMMIIFVTHICITRPQWVNSDDTLNWKVTLKYCLWKRPLGNTKFNSRIVHNPGLLRYIFL